MRSIYYNGQLRYYMIHLLQCSGLWGCCLKGGHDMCMWEHLYGGGGGSQRVTHSRDRKWLQYGPERGFLQSSREWFRLLVRIRTPRSGSKVKNTDVLFGPFETIDLWWASPRARGLLTVSLGQHTISWYVKKDLCHVGFDVKDAVFPDRCTSSFLLSSDH